MVAESAPRFAAKLENFMECTWMVEFSEQWLFRAVKQGGQAVGLSKDMLRYADALVDNEIQDVLAFVRTVCRR
ncbi:MAG TPA: hypothetical protein VK714_01630 [Myxococcota bacterium]|nr:hypothetical protein [Myxococcota bacterium]